ncbi:GNAT family N-acetyltransferase [Meiothermus granaticius]|uniref:Acetyltransferase (GNAT) domain protein n=2 Tax=Meiothermus TaxID=65551 RepID=A0A399F4S6_9DEIN|nr:GNAT family N-acetyltransferase [Meiothermus granaticius]RIH91060.1 Acetyltransferase (GNAT) domain protein [Meiothermus granaticius NBRC 107808]
MNVPILKTERLILRGHRRDDFEAFAEIYADPDVTRFIGGKSATREESWKRLLMIAGFWQVLGFGTWAVELRDESRYVGYVGFGDIRREIDPPLDGMPEGAWVLSSEVHGRGVATEAVRAALEWIDRHYHGNTTTCIIDPENAASIRLAEKVGYREYARSHYKDAKVIQFRRQRP